MKMKFIGMSVIFAALLANTATATAQEKPEKSSAKEGDRNVMLNASNNTGPRDVNIGLPASVGGTTILENNLPVVYFFWPELPTKAWRSDAMTNGVNLLDLGQTAIHVGDVGFSVNSMDNLGTDKFQGRGSLNSNHFGLMKGDINLSGPLTKNGLKYSVGAYLNFDPGTFNAHGIDNHYADKSQMYKATLTQDYKLEGIRGSITALYKYAKVEGIRNLYAPFLYKGKGKIDELDNFKMGGDSYMIPSQKITLRDAFTRELKENDILKDYGSESHTVDLIWKNQLSSGLNIDFIGRYHRALTGNYLPIMTGVYAAGGGYEYENGEAFTGDNVQKVMILASRRTPIQSFTSTLTIGKKSGRHDWSFGLNQWNYNIDKYATEGTMYYQEVAPNPRKLKTIGSESGNFGEILEYHNGSENKTALFITDKWDVTDLFTLNMGARIELQTLNGDYQDNSFNATEGLNGPKTAINKKWWNKAFMLSGVYKVTDKFGVLGEATYNEQGGHLENYNIGKDPLIKKSKIPGAGLGVFFNHPMISVVSKATYIQRDEYRTTTNFSNPNTGELQRLTTGYDIQTMGWTTDVVATPFKNFNLHFLLTLQSPKYKNFSGDVPFSDGTTSHYDFSDKTVTGVSKVLLEIDPSYTWNKLRVWASARYFSKQYINKPNTLELESRWETFAGLNYKISNNLDISGTVINLFNQRGASGSVPDGDLVLTNEDVAKKSNTIMSGSYILPLTVNFGVKYRF